MTSAPSNKRAWFQLHLSTCVVLMVVAGVLVWANFTNRVGEDWESVGDAILYGWPYPCFASWHQQEIRHTGELVLVEDGEGRRVWQASYRGLAANAGVAMIILGLTALICEFYGYRRARKRAAQDSKP